MKNIRFKNWGFSTVEVMTAIAIIAVLSAIAIPIYQSMAAKSKQAEAKNDLSAIYLSEKTFFTYHNTYSLCLFQIGYVPNTATYYISGYYNGGHGLCNGITCFAYQTNPEKDCVCAGPVPWNNGFRNDCTYVSAAMSGVGVLPYTWDVNGLTFTAGAAGFISGNTTVDAWTIDQNQTLTNVQSGY